MAAIKALVKPELLRWARGRAKVKPEDAAKAAHVPVERLQAWERENSEEAPTLGQLRDLAAKYHFPLAVFYLPEPPKDFAPLRDFRRLANVEEEPISANLAYHIRSAYDRRELALELFQEINSEPRRFPLAATIKDNPEKVGRAIREFLKVDSDSQMRAAGQGKAFDYWRRRLEENDILVFVVSGPHWSVDLKEMRGFAIAMPNLPVIVVNGKDYSQGGKAFTLIHELCHVLLGESAISNGAGEDPALRPADRRIERFCDAVAAATLMPLELIASFTEVARAELHEWSDEELRRIGGAIGVSRQALLLRFVTIKLATWSYYRERHDAFEEEYRQQAEDRAKKKKPVPIKRHIMLMSWNGRGFTRLVLRSYYDQRITLNDVSSYLGTKVKHIPALEHAAFQAAE
ncbi:putative Zn peptidase [Methylocella tundrae]|uniref:Putative Zn peptidase n=1 Tax=Methylocella tundrae TaxID=227605 RepID=A0A8B6M904_METTU|nr:ImmA/IrrE family metallo-endopeptidase [Methylocella tundrae]VTZ51390.1 putative Zn peptidase [Methylocella tundrae]